jgi:hypothetical protein
VPIGDNEVDLAPDVHWIGSDNANERGVLDNEGLLETVLSGGSCAYTHRMPRDTTSSRTEAIERVALMQPRIR